MKILKYQPNSIDEQNFMGFMCWFYGDNIGMERMSWGLWY